MKSKLGALALALSTVPLGADVLLNQTHDFKHRVLSFELAGARDAQSGDDFRPGESVLIESATFWMIASWPNVPHDWSLNIHDSTFNHPRFHWGPTYHWLYRISGAASVIDLGEWNDEADRHLFEVRFDNINFRLDPGPFVQGLYWFSPEGHIRDSDQKSYWGSANNGVVNGEQGWWKREPIDHTGWGPISIPTDWAMRIEGTPIADLPDDHSTEITGYQIITGDLIEGDLEDIIETDDSYLRLHSMRRPYHPSNEIVIHARSLIDDPDLLDLTIEHGAEPFAFSETAIYNWRTEEWDLLEDDFVGPPELTRAHHDLPAADYVSGWGEIKVRIHHELPSAQFARWFESHIDRVWIDVVELD